MHDPLLPQPAVQQGVAPDGACLDDRSLDATPDAPTASVRAPRVNAKSFGGRAWCQGGLSTGHASRKSPGVSWLSEGSAPGGAMAKGGGRHPYAGHRGARRGNRGPRRPPCPHERLDTGESSSIFLTLTRWQIDGLR